MENIPFDLRRWKPDDLDSLVRHADNFNVARFLTDKFPHPYTRRDGENFLAFACVAENILAIDLAGEAVGGIGVFPQDDVHSKNAEIGYWLSESYWGRGIVTEAVRRIVDFAFGKYDVERVFARPFGSNPGSHRVLEKAGFVFEARLEGAIFKNGEFLDELIYAVRRGNWRK